MSPLGTMLKLSDAQRRFLLDTRPYVRGSFNSPPVRTMRSLEAKGLISVDTEPSLRAYTTTLTAVGKAVRRRLVSRK